MGRNMPGRLAVLLLFCTLWPTGVLAEDRQGIGVVTTLKGHVTVTRTMSPPRTFPLNFKDQVFFKDRIVTQEQSLVQMLLGKKALITVRELSELTLTKEPGRPSSLGIAKGKLGLAVAQAQMNPDESIRVRTPNAIAAVHGAVMVIEVRPIAGRVLTDIHVTSGRADIFDSAGKRKQTLKAGMSVSVA